MVRKRHSLATRLAAWLLLGGLVPLLLLALGVYATARDQILERGRADAHDLADQTASAIEQSFRAVRASATMLARDIAYAQPSESQLIELARTLPQRFPAITDADGAPAPADIEFGFLNGELKLFQIRPFLESAQARSSSYLAALDQGMADLGAITVDLDALPGAPR